MQQFPLREAQQGSSGLGFQDWHSPPKSLHSLKHLQLVNENTCSWQHCKTKAKPTDGEQVGNRKVFSALQWWHGARKGSPELRALHIPGVGAGITRRQHMTVPLLKPGCRFQSYLPEDQPTKDFPECSVQTGECCFNYQVHRGCNMQITVKGLSESQINLAHPQGFGNSFSRL